MAVKTVEEFTREQLIADNETLRGMLKRGMTLHESEKRQLQIDMARVVIRIMDDLAAGANADETLMRAWRRAVAAAAPQMIEAFGGWDRGKTVYDPAEHTLIGVAAEPGEMVEMVRPGYRWFDGAGWTVLHKALVSGVER